MNTEYRNTEMRGVYRLSGSSACSVRPTASDRLRGAKKAFVYQYPLLVLGLAFLVGCATAKLPSGPDVFAPQVQPGQPKIGVAKVKDTRVSEKAGHIGATSITVKKQGLENLVTSYVIECFNRQLGVNVERVTAESPDEAKGLAGSRGVNGLLLAKIASLKLSSVDAIMEPVNVVLEVEVSLHDQTGRLLFKQVVTGHHSERIGITIVDKATGRLVDATARAFAQELGNQLNSSSVLKVLK